MPKRLVTHGQTEIVICADCQQNVTKPPRYKCGAELTVAKDGRALDVFAGRKNGDTAELAIADSFVAVLQRLDALAELLAHDLELREDMRGLPDKFRTIGDNCHRKHADDPERPSAEVPPIRV